MPSNFVNRMISHVFSKTLVCEKSPAKEYSAYFKKTVIFLTKDPGWLPGAVPCHRVGDPYWCIAEEIPRSKDSSGILYMQFDVGLLHGFVWDAFLVFRW